MQNINQSDYKNRLTLVKGLGTIPGNINSLCKDNNLLVLDALLDLLIKQEKFILDECQPILTNLTSKLKFKIIKFVTLQCKLNINKTYEVLVSFFSTKNSKLLCQMLQLLCELIMEFECQNIILENLIQLFNHPDSEVKKNGIKLCVKINSQTNVLDYLKEIKPILYKEIEVEISKGFEPEVKIKEEKAVEQVVKKEPLTPKKVITPATPTKKVIKKEDYDTDQIEYFYNKYPFLKEKNWSTRLSELKSNLDTFKNENQRDLAIFLSSSNEVISAICILFLEIFPVSYPNEFLTFIIKRITDIKIHNAIVEQIKKIEDKNTILTNLFENSRIKKGKVFVSTLKLFGLLFPEYISKDMLDTFFENSGVSGLIEKNAIKDLKNLMNDKQSEYIEESILEAEKSLSLLQINEEEDCLEKSKEEIKEEYIKEINQEKNQESKTDDKFKILFSITKSRVKNGQEIERFLSKQAVDYLKNESLEEIPANLTVNISDFLLNYIILRKLDPCFYVSKLLKQRYLASEFEIRTLIAYLMEKNNFSLLASLDKLFPVSKLQIILQRKLHENPELAIGVLNHWIDKYNTFRGDSMSYYMVLNNINDTNGISNLLKACPFLISRIKPLTNTGLTPLKKKLQKESSPIKEEILSKEEIQEPSFLDFLSNEGENDVFKEIKQDEEIECVRTRIYDAISSGNLNGSFSKKSSLELQLLEDDFNSEIDTSFILKANTMAQECLFKMEGDFENWIVELNSICKNKDLVNEMNYDTLKSIILEIFKIYDNRDDCRSICTNILYNITIYSKQHILLEVLLDCLQSNWKKVFQLLKTFCKSINILTQQSLDILALFYNQNPRICVEKVDLHNVMKDIIRKADPDAKAEGLLGVYLKGVSNKGQ